MNLDECFCDCHENRTIGDRFVFRHCMPCCVICVRCYRRVRMGATRWHEEQCQKEEKTMIDNFNDEQTIVLSEYEIANLRSLLEACGYPNGQCPKNPFYAANTGDW